MIISYVIEVKKIMPWGGSDYPATVYCNLTITNFVIPVTTGIHLPLEFIPAVDSRSAFGRRE